ncbi:MAG: ion channel [Methanothermobacter sp.]|nr:ion channel [Methanothermobacter sp.]
MEKIQEKFSLFLQVLILTLIILDGFLILISIFLPLKHATFSNVILFDLVTSIVLAIGYITRLKFGIINWNALIVSIPFYFIGVYALGLEPTSLILKPLNLLKVFGLFFAVKELASSVNEFVKKSRLTYGLSLFISSLLLFTILFFLEESPVNPAVNTYEDSLWYVLQTLTTVGYGDIIPVTVLGRLTGVMVMLSAIVATSLITASATSTLIEKFREEQDKILEERRYQLKKFEERIDEFQKRLEKIEEYNRKLIEMLKNK